MDCTADTVDAAVTVSINMASTTPSRVAAEKTGASLVLAAASRFTAITSPTSASDDPPMSAILPADRAALV